MRNSKYTKDLLEPIVRRSTSMAQVIAALGLRPTGGNYRFFNSRLRLLGIGTDHFVGQGWANGHTKFDHPALAQMAFRIGRPDEEVFVENSPETCGQRLTKRLLRRGWRYACEICGISEWQGKPLNLHLDHINGNHNDNRVENLQFLCPNCHAQTKTYCRRKMKHQGPVMELVDMQVLEACAERRAGSNPARATLANPIGTDAESPVDRSTGSPCPLPR